jgi:hypothetical protein
MRKRHFIPILLLQITIASRYIHQLTAALEDGGRKELKEREIKERKIYT